MRWLIVGFFSSLFPSAIAQFSHRAFPSMFWFRQTTARAEAMGKAYTSLDGDFGTVFANPAGLATAKESQYVYTHCDVVGKFNPQTYRYMGVSVQVKRRLNLAFSSFHSSNNAPPPANATRKPYQQRSMLTIAMEPWRNFYLGLNGNLLQFHPGYDRPSSTFFLDVGFVKKIPFATGAQKHWLNIGGSFVNSTWDKFDVKLPGGVNHYELPVIAKAGISYGTEWYNAASKDSVPILKVLLQSDYQKLLNSKFQTAFRFGAELTFFNLVSLRGGYLSEYVDNYGLPDYNASRIKKPTYGIGFQFPFHRWWQIPVAVMLDYAALPAEAYSFDPTLQRDFKSFTIGIKYMPLRTKSTR